MAKVQRGISVEDFLNCLRQSGLVSQGEMEMLATANRMQPPPKDGAALAGELVRQAKLTSYQAGVLLRGDPKGLVLGEYTVLDKIGAGGMGQVFKALHRRMGRTVALKSLPQGRMSSAESVLRFRQEVKAAAQLTHPNIVTAYDAGEHEGIHYLVMEYIAGTDLGHRVREQGPLAVGEVVQYMVQAARGLGHAHAHGIVHRDVKPGNLLLGPDGVVKVLDLGLAHMMTLSGEGEGALTETGAVMGTVDYMSPEQATDAKHVDQRADIYSLGCTLYYLLTGKPVYGGQTALQKIYAHQQHPIPSLRDSRPEVPDWLDAAFRRMVAKKAEDRYQVMGEVIEDLAHFHRPGKRRGRIWASLVLALLAAPVLVWGVAVGLPKAKSPKAAPAWEDRHPVKGEVAEAKKTVERGIAAAQAKRPEEKPTVEEMNEAILPPDQRTADLRLAVSPPAHRLGEEMSLFSGRDTAGWEFMSQRYKSEGQRKQARLDEAIRVESGVLHCREEPRYWLYTRAAYGDFVLKVEYRFPDEAKWGTGSAVLLRMTQPGPHHDAHVRVRFGGWATARILPALRGIGLAREGIKPLPGLAEAERPTGEWNELSIACVGGAIAVRVNGALVNQDYLEMAKEGRIGLAPQGCAVEFRKVTIALLR